MYKGYFVNNGRVMVSDENGNFSNFDYSDVSCYDSMQNSIYYPVSTGGSSGGGCSSCGGGCSSCGGGCSSCGGGGSW